MFPFADVWSVATRESLQSVSADGVNMQFVPDLARDPRR